MIGIFVGVLIGLITGTVFLFLVKTAWQNSADAKTIVKLTVEFLSIPTFWFGGPWCTTMIMKGVQLETLVGPYVVSLACTFGPIAIYVLIPLARSVSGVLKNPGGPHA